MSSRDRYQLTKPNAGRFVRAGAAVPKDAWPWIFLLYGVGGLMSSLLVPVPPQPFHLIVAVAYAAIFLTLLGLRIASYRARITLHGSLAGLMEKARREYYSIPAESRSTAETLWVEAKRLAVLEGTSGPHQHVRTTSDPLKDCVEGIAAIAAKWRRIEQNRIQVEVEVSGLSAKEHTRVVLESLDQAFGLSSEPEERVQSDRSEDIRQEDVKYLMWVGATNVDLKQEFTLPSGRKMSGLEMVKLQRKLDIRR